MKQEFIYHLIPENLQGDHLLPLNSMDKKSELYKGHARKYVGREELMKVTIPLLNCLWNDVVQFSALHPQVIADHLKKIQKDLTFKRLNILKLPMQVAIDRYSAVVFHSRPNKKKGEYSIYEDEVFRLEGSFKELSAVPQATLDFWELAKRGEAPFLWFPYVPHVFIKGAVDLADGEVIELKV